MVRGLKRIDKVSKLYHLSPDNHDGEVFHPRVPDSIIYGEEDSKHNRVCFSPTMSGCFRSISGCCTEVLYVHVPININEILKRGGLYKPSPNLVPDVDETNEHWCRRPVKLKCIGKAKFRMKHGYCQKPLVEINWLEKFN